MLHWVRGVGGISQNGGYFRHGIPVVWVVIGWLGFVVHWSAVLSAMSALKVQDQQDSGSVF